MPKIKTCKATHKGATYEAALSVDKSGVFSINRPGSPEDWPDFAFKLTGSVAADVVQAWSDAVRDLVERTKVEKKVIVVRFDSSLRAGGKKSTFTDDDAMLFLECGVALEVTTKQGDKTNIAYREHPDFAELHSPEQPFPVLMRLSVGNMEFYSSSCTVVEWTQELQDTLTRACLGIQSIVAMLDKVTLTPETLRLAISKMALLPYPLSDLNKQ